MLNSEYTASICTVSGLTSNSMIPLTSYSLLPIPDAFHRQLILSQVWNVASVLTTGSGGVDDWLSM